MANPSKQQGTGWETELVNRARDRGWNAWRISEGGAYDYGDVAIELPSGHTIVLEAKNRTNLNLHVTNDGAIRKVEANLDRIPHEVTAAGTAWKRLVGSPESKRRVQAGRPVIAFDVDTMFDLFGMMG